VTRSQEFQHEDTIKRVGILSTNPSIESAFLLSASLVRNRRLQLALSYASVGWTVGRRVFDYFNDRKHDNYYSIKIFEDDFVYPVIQRWFMDSLPAAQQKTIIAHTYVLDENDNDVFDGMPDPSHLSKSTVDSLTRNGGKRAKIDLNFDGSRRQKIDIDGHVVWIVVASDAESVDKAAAAGGARASYRRSLSIECKTLEAREAVLQRLEIEAQSSVHLRQPSMYVVDKWGEFSRSSAPARPAESVILRDGQSERIYHDIVTFLRNEPLYTKLGVPYHRGILLSGPPGTGKTSTATALASQLGLDIFYLNISSVKSDSDMLDLLRSVTPKSILLMEDVDIAHAVRERTDEEPGVTMSGLLNVLDGAVTPHGVIKILTTNYADRLDPAIVRPGRVDLLEEIGYVNDEQLRRICLYFMGYVPDSLPAIDESHEIVASEVVEVFKRYIEDVPQSELELIALLESRRNKCQTKSSTSSTNIS